ncbi:hypothetical protein ASPZODRAFT_126800 [Penicilliopsis zonata CBS 506.65]|uniref:Uncharacterized protein n=1 Tax=Penicilliopsis zonata CBS 506.65 TaxID=1073090 RepID=A0A1L9SUG4_9EURO|nr:hypothetical protein ASPZODRAFT_126800 [Penicilliopsis zonata CBS 506.65]OJJ50850.1 hypothetical protein ASPZODRAFT_126800 [Penicilliopsis zonata CBS 506.65]
MSIPIQRRIQILTGLAVVVWVLIIILSPRVDSSGASLSISRHFRGQKKPRYRRDVAVATYFSGETATSNDIQEDNYFIATRTLTYQLRHSPQTRLDPSIAFIILVTPDVSQRKRNQLVREGAIVIEVDKVETNLTVGEPRWRGCWTKLRLFDPEILPFERVLFMDSDTVLTRSVDGVFNDPAAKLHRTLNLTGQSQEDEAALPGKYLFAGKPEAGTYSHSYPPDMSGDYLNAGFFVYSPSHAILQHYLSLLELQGRFSPDMPEQNLLNYAHRRDGNMPWQKLHYSWNMNFVTPEDLRNQPASLHVKYWDKSLQQEVIDYALRCRWEMEGFWIGVNQRAKKIDLFNH